ncbi:MAG: clostripain-related cysteine peptidase [Candidatus Babeliales bacterium]
MSARQFLYTIVFFAGSFSLCAQTAQPENGVHQTTVDAVQVGQQVVDVDKVGIADWTIVVYLQADNSLYSFADYNIKDMQVGMKSNAKVNMLVQWDQPNNNKTWRYKVIPGGRVEVDSLAQEMGLNPQQELIDMMQWAKTKYPANHYALILWNHGSGVEDLRDPHAQMQQILSSWIEIPGTLTKKDIDRGILYDDSQGTVLTNQGLLNAMAGIKQILGKNIDIVGMDACLMAMVEVAFQIKDYADYFVASEEVEAGQGWAYSPWLAMVTQAKSPVEPYNLALSMVSGYKMFYQGNNNVQDFTLSAMHLADIPALKQNIDSVIAALDECKRVNKTNTLSAVKVARRLSEEFYYPEYIDLYTFYSALSKSLGKTSAPKSDKILQQSHKKATVSQKYVKAVSDLKVLLQAGMALIKQAVCSNVVGSEHSNAKGISIYYPAKGSLHPSYAPTLFARQSRWDYFLNNYR